METGKSAKTGQHKFNLLVIQYILLAGSSKTRTLLKVKLHEHNFSQI